MSEYSDYEQRLLSVIEQHGWQFTYVFDPDGQAPGFGYSVGFTKSLNAPEFIVFGLERGLMQRMLWEVHNQIKNGAFPDDNMRWQGVLEGFDCISRKAVHETLYSDYAVSADWYWRETGHSGNPQVYQLVWPGARQGLFPWETGCAQDVIDAQPHLWLSR